MTGCKPRSGDDEEPVHKRAMRVAQEAVLAGLQHDRERLLAHEVDGGRDVDAGAGQVEVVDAGLVVDPEDVRAGGKSVVTGWPPFVRVMVKPGPTVPSSGGTALDGRPSRTECLSIMDISCLAGTTRPWLVRP